jgi:hypothetical protein
VLGDALHVTSRHIKKDFSGFEEGRKTVVRRHVPAVPNTPPQLNSLNE